MRINVQSVLDILDDGHWRKMSSIHTELRNKGIDILMFVLRVNLQQMAGLNLIEIKTGKVTGILYYRKHKV